MNKISTPYYTLNQDELDKNLNQMKQALSEKFPDWIIGYSFKTNSLPWILKYMKKNGLYAEVVSYREYELAKYLGYKNIIYNGPMKNQETFFDALTSGHIINIETHREIDWLETVGFPVSVGIRVNFDIEKYCPGESACGSEGGRFGFCYENGELGRSIERIKKLSNVKLNGVHMHVSSKTRSLNIYRSISEVARQVISEYQLEVDYIDIGGGFFGGMPDKPSFFEYFEVIKQSLGEELSQKKIIVEPGASLVASIFSYTASVIDVKDTSYNRFVVIDGSRNDLDPQFKKSSYLYDILQNKKDSQRHSKQIVSGYTCMEADRLLTIYDELEVKAGDKIVFSKVGSYTMALAPNFIKYAPRVYLMQEGQLIEEIRKEWGVEEYVAGSKFD